VNSDQSHGQWQASIGNQATPLEGQDTKPVTPVASDPGSAPSSWGKKVVLLVDTNAHTRDSRAKIMRTLGVTVHCASSAGAARARFESGSYNLVLLDLGGDVDGAEHLAQEIKVKNPRQLVGFLVGSPLFVATSLSGKVTRRARVAPPATAVPVQKANPPMASGIDFGQKIRDAEAERSS
jgi:CheY-like chemotaxis protein